VRSTAQTAADTGRAFQPRLKPSENVAAFLKYVEPGNDAFADEQKAHELLARLNEFGKRLRQLSASDSAGASLDGLLAAAFRGGRLLPLQTLAVTRSESLTVLRATTLAQEATLDARAFADELQRLLAGWRAVSVAEFLVTAIEAGPEQTSTDVRYEIVGTGQTAARVAHVGTWRMKWRREAASWRIAEWIATSHVESRALRPAFSEITAAALAGNDSFRRQLAIPLDDWMATFDAALTRDSNGHHGVSVGDADGDGRDDLYVAQPAGLPNRLYRARGDGSFEDATERAGLNVLDDTAQSLFADVDNDGDQDLVLSTGTQPLLFRNDGSGRFSNVRDAFRYERPIQGSLTSIAMADYDKDGFLDLYVCAYAYFYGAGEDKAGTPAPYHDARNGPPAVLFRNDGRGRFVDVTREAGLDATNDRYHFAAAWGDYDGDGWPDLLVANDFGTKNLYRNRGRQNGKVRFEDATAQAGVLDHGAGMSAAFFDYDNDGRLDIYAGNMWSAVGRRVTAHAAFMKDASAELRALYRRHARGNSLFRNRGDGRFEDVTLLARAEMGRWAWSSDALDFDGDGFEDLYVANGMLTRAPPELDGFFWRQVVARSPETRVTGTPYDDAWRAINELVIRGSLASRERNVFLRNDGRGGFDDVSGALGLDLDQDGRSFAVMDADADGDPDLAVMAARQAPQLRLFRNDFADRGAAIAIRLTGVASNRDAVGARVTVTAGALRRSKTVQAGSGFLSQHSKELLIGLGASAPTVTLNVEWPSGRTQSFADVAVNHRLRLREGGELEREPFAPARAAPAVVAAETPAAPPIGTWLYEPFPAPEFSAVDLRGRRQSLAALRGRPAALLFWASDVPAARAAFAALARGHDALREAGIGALAVALDAPSERERLRALAARHELPFVHASEEIALGYTIANRHLFMNRQDLRLPTLFLLDAAGRIVKAYRGSAGVAEILADAARIDAAPEQRLARAVPFAGTHHTPLGARNYVPYGRELQDQGLERAAVVAFEHAAQASPNAATLYRLGTLLVKGGEHDKARTAFERALAMQPDLSEASNDLGALLAQAGDVPGAIERFRAALAASPDYPDALNNLGYALLLSGHERDARECYEKALKLQPDFPEALNNLGLLFGRAGDLDRAEGLFRDALARREDYGEAANNVALVLVARERRADAIALLEAFLEKQPAFEPTYITLAKVYLSMDERKQGLAVLERLLQRNPRHEQARELFRLFGGGGED
jgi:Flp pilus assembly protein TadD